MQGAFRAAQINVDFSARTALRPLPRFAKGAN